MYYEVFAVVWSTVSLLLSGPVYLELQKFEDVSLKYRDQVLALDYFASNNYTPYVRGISSKLIVFNSTINSAIESLVLKIYRANKRCIVICRQHITQAEPSCT